MKPPKDTTILVVDDEKCLRVAVVASLKRKGYQVVSASSGREAFGALAQQKIDLVISDVRMPDGDGMELLAKVKCRDPEFPVVVFITGFTDLTVEDAHEMGADAILKKPFSLQSLYFLVSHALASRSEKWSSTPEAGAERKLRGRILSVGRGGLFISSPDPVPVASTRVALELDSAGPETPKMQGLGIIKWVRKVHGTDKPAGCGVELIHVHEPGRTQLLRLIAKCCPKSYIPNR